MTGDVGCHGVPGVSHVDEVERCVDGELHGDGALFVGFDRGDGNHGGRGDAIDLDRNANLDVQRLVGLIDQQQFNRRIAGFDHVVWTVESEPAQLDRAFVFVVMVPVERGLLFAFAVRVFRAAQRVGRRVQSTAQGGRSRRRAAEVGRDESVDRVVKLDEAVVVLVGGVETLDLDGS